MKASVKTMNQQDVVRIGAIVPSSLVHASEGETRLPNLCHNERYMIEA